mgnify:CR=1 FL=1
MIKIYFLAGALILMAAQAIFIKAKLNQIDELKAHNAILEINRESLNKALEELKTRHAKELEAIKSLDENKTQIIYKIDAVKAKIDKDKSDIVVKFNKALDEIYNNLN